MTHSIEKLSEDLDRQSALGRMGWIFTRIRSSEFLRNPARVMKPVFEKLHMLEMPPAGNSADADPAGLAYMMWSTASSAAPNTFAGIGRKPMEQVPVRLPGLRRLPRSSEILQCDENEDGTHADA